MSVAPRWKRRADEIAEAIGDELSINGTVSIGNDINLSVATISLLAEAITNVLNPTDIAAAMYALTMPVSVVSTNTTPVHVQVRNISGGFTAMGTDISTSMKLTPQPISIADTVDVKTASGESVAITGTVNANVGSATLPISNPNNITVPVVNSGNITVPVSLGGVTVPVRASANGTGQNSGGVNVLVSVNPTHSVTVPVSVGSATVPVSVPSGLTVPASVASNLTVPVAVGGATVPAYVPNNLTVPASVPSGLTVPVAVGSNTVPVSVGSATVPVANTNSVVCVVENTNNVTVPVTSGGTVDVNIKTIEASAKTQFHEAMQTALDEATDIDVIDVTGSTRGIVNSWMGTSGDATWSILRDDGTTVNSQTLYVRNVSPYWIPGNSDNQELYVGRRVIQNVNAGNGYWQLEDGVSGPPMNSGIGTITSKGTGYNVTADNGMRYTNVTVMINGTYQNPSSTSHHGRRVAITIAGNYSNWELMDL